MHCFYHSQEYDCKLVKDQNDKREKKNKVKIYVHRCMQKHHMLRKLIDNSVWNIAHSYHGILHSYWKVQIRAVLIFLETLPDSIVNQKNDSKWQKSV